MGGGKPKNKQNNKSKIAPSNRILLSGTGAGGGASGGEGSQNVCIIAFDTILDIPTVPNPPRQGDNLFFVPSDTANTFSVWSGPTELCAYTGQNAALMWRCANDGYEYHGSVTSVENEGGRMRLSCKVETFGRE